MRITNILDRLEDRITETIKSWNSQESVDSLEFDLALIEKDIELIKMLTLKIRKTNE